MTRTAVHWLVRLLLMVAGTGIALGAGELGLRVAGAPEQLFTEVLDPGNAESHCSQPSLTRGWTPIPEMCERNAQGAFPAPTPAHPPSDDRFDVVLVGDSVACQRAWVDRAAQVGGPQVQIWNHCASGYDTCQELDLLRELDLIQTADLLIVQTCPNDLSGSPVMVPQDGGWTRLFLGDTVVDLPPGGLHSRLVLYLSTLFARRVVAERNASDDIGRCLEEVVALGSRHNVPVLIAQFPALFPNTPEHHRHPQMQHEQSLQSLVTQLGVDTFSVRPVLEGHLGRTDPVLWRARESDHIHLSRTAQQHVGDALGQELARRQATPTP